jgi:hypothetical protein
MKYRTFVPPVLLVSRASVRWLGCKQAVASEPFVIDRAHHLNAALLLFGRLLTVLTAFGVLGCGQTKPDPVQVQPDTAQDVQDSDAVDAQGPDLDAGQGSDAADVFVPAGPPCSMPAQCKKFPQTPYCAEAVGACVACLFDANCPPGLQCQGYYCKSFACEPGKKSCSNSITAATCNPDGKTLALQACGPDPGQCLDGECRKCAPNKVFCAPAAAPDPANPSQVVSPAIVQCGADGQNWSTLQTCPAGQGCYRLSPSEVACRSCQPGSFQCQGDIALRCAGDGSGLEVIADCSQQGWKCLGGGCVDPCTTDLKSAANNGCEYFAVDLDNAVLPDGAGGQHDAQNAQYAVIVANQEGKPATIKVTAGSGQQVSYVVLPGQLKVLNLPDPTWLQPGGAPLQALQQDGSGVNKNLYRIESNRPIVAFQFNPLQNTGVFSNDASLLLPTSSLGTRYRAVTRRQSHPLLRSYLTVVAAKPGATTVQVTTTAPLQAGPGVVELPAGATHTWLLQQGQVLNLETDAFGADLSGSLVVADQPVAVFSGSEAANAPNTDVCLSGQCVGSNWPCVLDTDCPQTCCADHLEEQLFPRHAWGQSFHVSKFKFRGQEPDLLRFVADEPDTQVTLTPPVATVPVLQPGQWYEVELKTDVVVTASKPIQIAQYLVSAYAPGPNNDTCTASLNNQPICEQLWQTQEQPIACSADIDCPNVPEAADAKTGDPAMLLAVTDNQWLRDYTFLVPDKYAQHFINVHLPPGATATLDGVQLSGATFAFFPDGYSVARLPVKAGVHQLKASAPVGLMVYGWSDFVSYGYPGGAGLAQ